MTSFVKRPFAVNIFASLGFDLRSSLERYCQRCVSVALELCRVLCDDHELTAQTNAEVHARKRIYNGRRERWVWPSGDALAHHWLQPRFTYRWWTPESRFQTLSKSRMFFRFTLSDIRTYVSPQHYLGRIQDWCRLLSCAWWRRKLPAHQTRNF